MSDFITLTCPSCGGKLQLTSDIERFACAHCGTEHVVKRGGGILSLAPVVEGIQQVRTGVDKTASELAIRRLREEIEALEAQKKRVMGQSGLGDVVGPFLGVVAGVVVVLLVDALLRPDSLGPAILVGALVAIVIIVWGVRQVGRQNRMKCAPLDQEIAQKLAEVERHRRLVSQ